MRANGPRFEAREDTEHSCCWDASVFDTLAEPRYVGDTGAGMICECSDMETAIEIATALNRSAMDE